MDNCVFSRVPATWGLVDTLDSLPVLDKNYSAVLVCVFVGIDKERKMEEKNMAKDTLEYVYLNFRI